MDIISVGQGGVLALLTPLATRLNILSNANDTELANNVINIGLNCKNHGVSKVFISSILVKKNPKSNPVIRRFNNQLRELCEVNGFLFNNNNMITTDHLRSDGFISKMLIQISCLEISARF